MTARNNSLNEDSAVAPVVLAVRCDNPVVSSGGRSCRIDSSSSSCDNDRSSAVGSDERKDDTGYESDRSSSVGGDRLLNSWSEDLAVDRLGDAAAVASSGVTSSVADPGS